jgi:hypothetical protein
VKSALAVGIAKELLLATRFKILSASNTGTNLGVENFAQHGQADGCHNATSEYG